MVVALIEVIEEESERVTAEVEALSGETGAAWSANTSSKMIGCCAPGPSQSSRCSGSLGNSRRYSEFFTISATRSDATKLE